MEIDGAAIVSQWEVIRHAIISQEDDDNNNNNDVAVADKKRVGPVSKQHKDNNNNKFDLHQREGTEGKSPV